MKKLFIIFLAMAVLAPLPAFSQVPAFFQVPWDDWRHDARIFLETGAVQQDDQRVVDDRVVLAEDQGALDRDGSNLHFWSLLADHARLQADRERLNTDLETYYRDSFTLDADRLGPVPGTRY